MATKKLYESEPMIAGGATLEARSRITVWNDDKDYTWIQIEAGNGPDQNDMFNVRAPARLKPALREALIEMLNRANDAATGGGANMINSQSNTAMMEVGDKTIMVTTSVHSFLTNEDDVKGDQVNDEHGNDPPATELPWEHVQSKH